MCAQAPAGLYTHDVALKRDTKKEIRRDLASVGKLHDRVTPKTSLDEVTSSITPWQRTFVLWLNVYLVSEIFI